MLPCTKTSPFHPNTSRDKFNQVLLQEAIKAGIKAESDKGMRLHVHGTITLLHEYTPGT